MSRIIVKNLPAECDEARLRAFVGGAFSDVSDVKVARTRAGASRRFGFVGFRAADTGARAVAHLHRAFMGAVRLEAAAAAAVGAAPLLVRAAGGSGGGGGGGGGGGAGGRSVCDSACSRTSAVLSPLPPPPPPPPPLPPAARRRCRPPSHGLPLAARDASTATRTTYGSAPSPRST